MPDEDNLPVYVCQDPESSLHKLWLQVKHYDSAGQVVDLDPGNRICSWTSKA